MFSNKYKEYYADLKRVIKHKSPENKFPPIHPTILTLGCDPEFFIRQNKKIVESSKFIPEHGIQCPPLYTFGGNNVVNKIICDGIQAELNPAPDTCRERLASKIAMSIVSLNEKMATDNGKINFGGVVKFTDKEMESFSDKSKRFGCAPSHNVYKNNSTSQILVNPMTYQYRSAGGHIHIGSNDSMIIEALQKDLPTMIKSLDMFCGNICVLIDRDDMQKERRRVYGKAGEYRLPAHGIEYRVPSNFWLGNYQLLSLVLGLARMAAQLAINIYIYEKQYNDEVSPLREILDLVPLEDLETAINDNDFYLAKLNYEKIRKAIAEITCSYSYSYPLNSETLDYFDYFVEKVKTNGLSYWFKQTPLHYWKVYSKHGPNNRRSVFTYGWQNFCEKYVKNKMELAKIDITSKVNKFEIKDNLIGMNEELLGVVV